MAKSSDWNPDLYLQFKDERTQPSIDLVARIAVAQPPRTILDVGCGPGNSTQILRRRWPDARITGIDNSPAMIDKAHEDFPDQEWILTDAFGYEPDKRYDLLFSNATIQWIPDHDKLMRKFTSLLSDRGVLAIQLPLFNLMPVGRAIGSVAAGPRFKTATAGCARLFTYHEPGFYHDSLCALVKHSELWVTDYYHVLASPAAIVDFVRGAGMRPWLDCLANDEERKAFEEAVLTETEKAYPLQRDSRVLFPFKRLFFIEYK